MLSAVLPCQVLIILHDHTDKNKTVGTTLKLAIQNMNFNFSA